MDCSEALVPIFKVNTQLRGGLSDYIVNLLLFLETKEEILLTSEYTFVNIVSAFPPKDPKIMHLLCSKIFGHKDLNN